MNQGQELYVKAMQGKRTRYIPYQPEMTDMELSEAQILTIAGALGVTVLQQYQQLVPSHKRSARKIKAVEQSLLDLLHGNGQAIDPVMADYAMACWNKAAIIMSLGAKEAR
jgi:hypothetical protein